MSSGQGPGFLEDARRTRRGDAPTSLAWNAVNISGEVMLIERPNANNASGGHSMRPSTTIKQKTVTTRNRDKSKLKRNDDSSHRTSTKDSDEREQDDQAPHADNGRNVGSSEENTMIPYSLAYVMKGNKTQCSMCTMWFDRNSMSYQVPRHRIVELQRKWKFERTGRRYRNASYLYGIVEVCRFCSQLFEDASESKHVHKYDEFVETRKEIVVSTGDVLRSDLTQDPSARAYQSSVVDNRGAVYPLAPPYDNGGSRTRREVDPWWEIDLGHTTSVHSVSFSAIGTQQMKMHVFVLLLSAPVGFENPFLDQLIPHCVEWKEFVFPACESPKDESATFEVPGGAMCGAVRIQIRGVQVLRLTRCQVFQGDDAPPQDIHTILADEVVRSGSFAPHPLTIFDGVKKEAKRRNLKKVVQLDVKSLSKRLEMRKIRTQWWLDRAKGAASYFTLDELLALRDAVFAPIAKWPPYGTAMRNALGAHELKHNALMQHQPRCSFSDLMVQLRQVHDLIETKQQTREIHTFISSRDKLFFFFFEGGDVMARMDTVCEFMTNVWGSKRVSSTGGRGRASPLADTPLQRSPIASARGDLGDAETGLKSGGNSRRPSLLPKSDFSATFLTETGPRVVPELQESRGSVQSPVKYVEPKSLDGIAWSHFVMILHRMCLDDVENIPEYAFGVTEGVDVLFPIPDIDSVFGGNADGEESLGALDQADFQRSLASTAASVVSKAGHPIIRRRFTPPPVFGFRPNSPQGTTRLGSPPGSRGLVITPSRGGITGDFDSTGVLMSPSLKYAPLSPINSSTAATTAAMRNALYDSPPRTDIAQAIAPNANPMSSSNIYGGDAFAVSEHRNTTGSRREARPHTSRAPKTSLLELTRDPLMPVLNFSHSLYKIQMIKRKAKFDREFPKHLDKSFPIESPLSRFNLAFKKSEKKVSNGAAADADSTSEVHGDPSIVVSDRNISDSLSLALPGLEGSTVSAVGHRNSVLSHSQSTVSNKGNAENKTPNPTNTTSNHEKSAKRLSSMAKKGSSHNISGDDILGDPFFLDDSDSDTYYDDESSVSAQGAMENQSVKYKRFCSLCTYGFPLDEVRDKVMNKHIGTIRQYVDPNYEGMAEHLAVGMNPYNYVYLCIFCAQFVEPDAPGGIIFPDISKTSALVRGSNVGHIDEHSATATSSAAGSGSLTFFDDRYPDTMRLEDPKAAEDARQFQQFMTKTRARARVAMDIARALKEAKAISAKRRADLELVDSQIAAGFGNAVVRSSSPIKYDRDKTR